MELSSLKGAYLEAVSEARALRRLRIEEGAIIAYGLGAEAPAHLLYLGMLHSGRSAALLPASTAAYHLVPYRDPDSALIVFAYSQRDPRVVHAVEAASLVGFDTYLVAPKLHDAYEEKVSALDVERVSVGGPGPLFSMSLYSLLITPSLSGFRKERLRRELDEVASAFDWVLETFSGEIGEMRTRPENVLSTPSTLPGAFYYCKVTGCASVSLLDAALEYPSRALKNSVAYVTSVEERGYRDIVSRLGSVGARIIRLNTDPLTSSLYIITMSAIAARRLL
jgi:hypothetical protein